MPIPDTDAECGCFDFSEKNMRIEGTAIVNGSSYRKMRTATVEDCQHVCMIDRQCQCWTYYEGGCPDETFDITISD